jgi:type III pantothenate kinase
MDINLLVIGVGNSRLHVGAFIAGELRHVRHLTIEQQSDWPSLLGETWAELASLEGAEVAGCSVVPDLAGVVEDAARRATGQSIQWVGSDLDRPIEVTTDEPTQTGIDRVLVTAAAYEQLGKACVVVDAGTALTVNLCDETGRLTGGAIAPGVAMMMRSMHRDTAGLPAASFETPGRSFGTNTVESMRHGVMQSLRGLVQSIAEAWATEQGRWPEVIATGGDAHALFDRWEVVHAISPDLLLYGIALAYSNHHIRHGT